MRTSLVLFAVAGVLAGCRDRPAADPPDPAPVRARDARAPAPPPARWIDVAECHAVGGAIDALLACPAGAAALADWADWRQVHGASPVDADRPESFARDRCRTVLVRVAAAAAAAGCALPLDDAARGWIAERRARRTAPPRTGSDPLDAALAGLAALRDRACACADDGCAEAAHGEGRHLAYPGLGEHRGALAAHDTILGELTDCTLFPALRTPAGER
jgi:hypothetical protein